MAEPSTKGQQQKMSHQNWKDNSVISHRKSYRENRALVDAINSRARIDKARRGDWPLWLEFQEQRRIHGEGGWVGHRAQYAITAARAVMAVHAQIECGNLRIEWNYDNDGDQSWADQDCQGPRDNEGRTKAMRDYADGSLVDYTCRIDRRCGSCAAWDEYVVSLHGISMYETPDDPKNDYARSIEADLCVELCGESCAHCCGTKLDSSDDASDDSAQIACLACCGGGAGDE